MYFQQVIINSRQKPHLRISRSGVRVPFGVPGQVDTNFDTMSIDVVSTFFMKSLDLQQFFDIIL